MDMNASSFHRYVEQELGPDYAKFICDELAFVIPMSFAFFDTIDDVRSHIYRCTANMTDPSRARFFYCDKAGQPEIKSTMLGTIEKLRQDVWSVMNRKRKTMGTLS